MREALHVWCEGRSSGAAEWKRGTGQGWGQGTELLCRLRAGHLPLSRGSPPRKAPDLAQGCSGASWCSRDYLAHDRSGCPAPIPKLSRDPTVSPRSEKLRCAQGGLLTTRGRSYREIPRVLGARNQRRRPDTYFFITPQMHSPSGDKGPTAPGFPRGVVGRQRPVRDAPCGLYVTWAGGRLGSARIQA